MPSIEKPSILLLDDEEDFRDVAARALKAGGCSVLHTGNPMEALRALDSSVPLDLLVTDIVMPPSMPHGIAVAHMAKNKRPGIGIIYMTGHPDKMPEGEIDADATPLLLKPLRLDTLLDAVADVLGRGASAPS